MKKIRAIVLVLYALAMCLPIGAVPAMAAAPQSGKLSVVCTIFPQYDWVRQILGDKADGVDLTLLLDSGIDLHSFQPSAEDMVKISTSDLFIYVGGESDMWVADALKQSQTRQDRHQPGGGAGFRSQDRGIGRGDGGGRRTLARSRRARGRA